MTFHKLSAALAAAISAVIAQISLATDDYQKNDYQEEVIVSASPLDKTDSVNTRPAAVLSGDQLATQAAATLGETLSGQLGVSSASFGPGVGSPVIRGQQGHRVKVMQDNLDTLDAANSSSDHANATEALLADRIEILRGPQTLRYGNGAIGGIVNVIDNRIPNQRQNGVKGALESRHNNANDETASLFRLDGGKGNFAWHLDGLYRDSGNVRIDGPADVRGGDETSVDVIDNSDGQASSGTAGVSLIGNRGYLGLSVQTLENQYGIPPGAHEHHEEIENQGDAHTGEERVRIDMQQTRYDLKAGLDQPIVGIDTLRLRLGYVDYEHTELEGGVAGTVFDSDAVEARLELVHIPVTAFGGAWRGAFGLQALDRDFAAIGDEAFIPQTDTRTFGVFAVEEREWDQWLVELGARLEHQALDPLSGQSEDHHTTSFSLASQYRLSPKQRFNLVLSRSQRAPSVEELFSDGAHLAEQAMIKGNSNLNAETSRNLELGYNYREQNADGEDNLEIEINLFYNDISDFIYRRNTNTVDPVEELTIYRYDQEDARFRGVEAQLHLPLNEYFALRLFGDYVRAELDQQGDVPRVSPPRLGAEVQFERDDWHARLRLTEVDDQVHPGNFEDETDGYTRLEFQLNRRFMWSDIDMLVFIKGQNLLNEEIRNASSFLRTIAPEAGRGFSVGLRLSF